MEAKFYKYWQYRGWFWKVGKGSGYAFTKRGAIRAAKKSAAKQDSLKKNQEFRLEF